MLKITQHAYDQYQKRVREVSFDRLYAECLEDLKGAHREREYIELGGAWWVFVQDGNRVTLVTCYGEFPYYLPDVLKWAKENNDRVKMG